MIRVYRQDELSRRYPSSTWVLESDGGLYATVKNPFAASWWRTWVFAPEWEGMRRVGLREGLTLVRVTRPVRQRGGPGPAPTQPEPEPETPQADPPEGDERGSSRAEGGDQA